jgi:hypothetical protein
VVPYLTDWFYSQKRVEKKRKSYTGSKKPLPTLIKEKEPLWYLVPSIAFCNCTLQPCRVHVFQPLSTAMQSACFPVACHAQSLAATNRVTEQLVGRLLRVTSVLFNKLNGQSCLYLRCLWTKQGKPPRWRNHPAEECVFCIAVVPNASTSSVYPRLCTRSLLILVCASESASATHL